MASAWDPELYARFRRERSQPFFDLVALVRKRPGMRVVDLGCGSGELTAWLHGELQAAETLGVDSSDTMLAEAQQHATQGLSFERGDIARFEPAGEFDLVFSNAALQWVPDHSVLLARLTALLAPDGQLAVQMPRNWQHPSHTTAAALAREAPYATALGGYTSEDTEANVLTPEEYAALLYRLGFAEQHVRLQIFVHPLPGPEAVLEWVRGTLLTAYQSRLTPALYDAFLDEYGRRLRGELGSERPYLYLYPRILLWARR
jgi:trans-aconitate 2-methyltransferase